MVDGREEGGREMEEGGGTEREEGRKRVARKKYTYRKYSTASIFDSAYYTFLPFMLASVPNTTISYTQTALVYRVVLSQSR